MLNSVRLADKGALPPLANQAAGGCGNRARPGIIWVLRPGHPISMPRDAIVPPSVARARNATLGTDGLHPVCAQFAPSLQLICNGRLDSTPCTGLRHSFRSPLILHVGTGQKINPGSGANRRCEVQQEVFQMLSFNLNGRAYVALHNLLKFEGWAETGAAAKQFIDEGQVTVDGRKELRRRCKITVGQVVQMGDLSIRVADQDEG